MSKVWLIARNTYRSRVRSGTFLFLTFALPVLMIVAGGIAFLNASRDLEPVSIGVLDRTRQLAYVDRVSAEGVVLIFTHFGNAEQARNAVRDETIAGYLLIPEGYLEGEPVQFYGREEPEVGLSAALQQFMRRALLPEAPDEILARLENPAEYTYTSLESGDEITTGSGLVIRILIPILLAIIFSLAVTFSTGQMGTAVVREKDQRAMEIVVTSLRPFELVSGKVLGMSLLALTQFTVWFVGGIIALVLAALGGLEVSQISVPWEVIVWGLLLIVPGYLLFAMMGAGLGVIAGDTQHAQQLAGLFGLFGFVPIWFTATLVSAPNGTMAVFMSLFPLTAPPVMLFRMAFTNVPLWQLALSLALIVLSLLLATWLVARVFRAAMLVYGLTLHPRQIWQALRQG